MNEESFKGYLDKLSSQQIESLILKLAALHDKEIDQLVAIISH